MPCSAPPAWHPQENVYQDERPFVSAKKIMHDLGEPYRSHVELLSFHTVSKVRTQNVHH